MDTVEYRANFGRDHGMARMLLAFACSWCGNHCTSDWDCEQDSGMVRLKIPARDIVLFHLSHTGDIFEQYAA